MKNNFYKVILFYFLLLMSYREARSQNSVSQMEKMINIEIDSVRRGVNISFDYQFDSSNEDHFLNYLKRFDTSKESRIRNKLQMFKAQIGLKSKSLLIRRNVVQDFVLDCFTQNDDITQYACNRLIKFTEKDFSDKAKLYMDSLFKNRFYNHNFILACGIAQVKSLLPLMTQLSKNFKRSQRSWYNSNEWIFLITSARLGDTSRVDIIIASVELELKLNFRVSTLLNYIGYTKLPDCYKLLQKYLESTEFIQNSSSPIGSSESVNQFALDYLAKYYNNFPIKIRQSRNYTKEEIEIAKVFLKQQNNANAEMIR